MKYNVYVSSCTVDGGIYTYELNEEGKLNFKSSVNMPEPMHMILKDDVMHILLKRPLPDNISALTKCDVSDDGVLGQPDEFVSTLGSEACHLAEYEGSIYCVNYISGSVIKMPDTLVTHSGSGPHPVRQTSAHTHFVGQTPDGKYLCVTDLGTDEIYLYDKNLIPKDKIAIEAGQGPRHIVFSDDGKYMFVANELGSSVSYFKYDGNGFEFEDTINCLPADFKEKNTASAIRFKDDTVYVGQRGLDSISVMPFKDGKLSLKQNVHCCGSYVRDFDFAGDFIICANQFSDDVTVLKQEGDSWVLADKVELGTPLCIVTEEK